MKLRIMILFTTTLLFFTGCGFLEETSFIGADGNGGPSFSPTPFAWATGDRSTNSTNINQTTAYALEWNTSDFDATYFTHSILTNPEELTVNIDGNYFAAVTIPMTAAVVRSCVQAEIRVNNTAVDGALSECSYIRGDTGHNESSLHITALLPALSAGDVIEVFVMATGAGGTVTISGNAALYVEYVSSSRTIFSGTATRTTNSTNLNQTTAYPLQWTEVVKSTGFTHADGANPENITVDQTGNYLLFVNLPLYSITAERQNTKILVMDDGVTVPGGEGRQGYIRVASGHENASAHWSGLIYNVTAGSTITVKAIREADSDTVTVGSKRASIYIERINSAGYIFFSRGTALTGGTNWNVTPAQFINWINDDIIDTNTYTHSTAADQHQITINTDGDYLLIYNDALSIGTATPYRENVKVTININGAPVSGAETKCHYIRSETNHEQSSGTMVYLLNNLIAGDLVTIQAERESELATGDVTADQEALLMLWRKQ